MAKTAKFLDDIKDLGFRSAFKGGLSIGLNDILIPKDKEQTDCQSQRRNWRNP
jgi:DNA-directed RNA polymerase subunit beta'